jgi:enoyl-[acyl-carrier-protein] reductase (NADH)
VCSEIGLDDDVVVRPGEFFDRTCEISHRGAVLAHRAVVRSHHAEVVCFLLSDLARAITGEVLHVDGGFNAMAAALRE